MLPRSAPGILHAYIVVVVGLGILNARIGVSFIKLLNTTSDWYLWRMTLHIRVACNQRHPNERRSISGFVDTSHPVGDHMCSQTTLQPIARTLPLFFNTFISHPSLLKTNLIRLIYKTVECLIYPCLYFFVFQCFANLVFISIYIDLIKSPLCRANKYHKLSRVTLSAQIVFETIHGIASPWLTSGLVL
jgi:hypothetical protein